MASEPTELPAAAGFAQAPPCHLAKEQLLESQPGPPEPGLCELASGSQLQARSRDLNVF